jgi:acyl dehydratase
VRVDNRVTERNEVWTGADAVAHGTPDPAAPDETVVRGPYFEELSIGQVFDGAPPVTLTDGLAAAHQAIVGDRLRLHTSHALAESILGRAPIAPSALVWNLAIGQSSEATQHVRANLYYRGLVLSRLPLLGDTLSTRTQVVGLKQNRARPDRPATGLAALRIKTVDQLGRNVLDFERCAMIPLGERDRRTGDSDDLRRPSNSVADEHIRAVTEGWNTPAPGHERVRAGQCFVVEARDVVSSAPELARLTMNIAAVHHDARSAGGRRLVFGGHTIAVALSQAARALPDLLTVVAWRSCDHLAPVHEGDLLSSSVYVEDARPLPGGGRRLDLRSRVWSTDAEAGGTTEVLDWRFVAISS